MYQSFRSLKWPTLAPDCVQHDLVYRPTESSVLNPGSLGSGCKVIRPPPCPQKIRQNQNCFQKKTWIPGGEEAGEKNQEARMEADEGVRAEPRQGEDGAEKKRLEVSGSGHQSDLHTQVWVGRIREAGWGPGVGDHHQIRDLLKDSGWWLTFGLDFSSAFVWKV